MVNSAICQFKRNIEFKAPYDVQRGKDQLHFTYLDVIGRPVVVINKNNVVDFHIQDFEVSINIYMLNVFLA